MEPFVESQLTMANLENSDSMVQPQMAQDQFRNVSNMDMVETNRIREPINAGNRLLYADFFTLKCRIHALTVQRHKIFTQCYQ